MTFRRSLAVGLLSALVASGSSCADSVPQPAALQPGEPCAFCRMMVSDPRFAAQIVAPGEEPLFFDDIGCLANQLRGGPRSAGAMAYVADHRTRDWIPAADALYTRIDALSTPMGSHLVAHADAASRDQDPDARGGMDVTVSEVFGGTLPRRSDNAR
jgi:copper chaperone NosL